MRHVGRSVASGHRLHPAGSVLWRAAGKRSLDSLQDAVDTVLASAKIDADASAKRIRAALACLKDDGEGFEFLFSDRLALISKPLDDLKLLVKARIDAHKAAEAEKERAKAAAAPVAAVVVAAPVAPLTVRQTIAARPAVAIDNRPPMATGAVCERLGFNVTAALIQSLGIQPVARPADVGPRAHTGVYWAEADFVRICRALIDHIESVAESAVAAA